MKRTSSAYQYAKQTGLTDKSLLVIVSLISFTQGLIESTDDLFELILEIIFSKKSFLKNDFYELFPRLL